MSHEVENMFSVKETPWHSLGKIVKDAPSIAAAIALAGLDWKVREETLSMADGRAVEAKAIVRDTDNQILGHHVGKDWTPVQNVDAFAWFAPFVDAGEASLETAGSLRHGERVWVLAKLNREPSVIVPKADDVVNKFLLLSNSHDGTLAVRVGFTPIRVVCANTLAMAHGPGGKAPALLKVRHTKGVANVLAEVRETVDAANATFEKSAEAYRALAGIQVTGKQVRELARAVFAPKTPKRWLARQAAAKRTAAPAKQVNFLDDIMAGVELPASLCVTTAADDLMDEYISKAEQEVERRFVEGRGNSLPGVAGTAWAAYNAVQEYLQDGRRGTAESRLESLAFGGGATENAIALQKALDFGRMGR